MSRQQKTDSGTNVSVEKETTDRTYRFKLADGCYKVIANLIDWNQEPGALDKENNPTEHALPDLIIFIEKITDTEMIKFKKDIETFSKEDALR